ncbi:ABC transporter [Streptomyces longispororuber]|uniref:ABC transporter n=1 Tax=Streptomyces longispororuber TaxID=68230 RepID=UPI00340D4818
MAALLRYRTALLLRSQRWLAPVILYAVFLAVGVQGGQPVLDSLAYAAAALLPVAAWLVRICVTVEPAAARGCTAAAAGPRRAHLAGPLTAFLAAGVLGAAATGAVAVISDAASTDHRTAVARGPAAAAGLLAMLVSALVGTAVGVLTSRPVLRSTGVAVPALLLAALLALVTTGSPAKAALTDLTRGSRAGVVPLPVGAVAAALALAVAAVATACGVCARRS